MNIELLILSFVAPLVVCALFTALARRGRWTARFVEAPDGMRRLHAQPTPKLGGVAVYLAVIPIVAALVVWSDPVLARGSRNTLLLLLAGATGMLLLGLIDDLRHLKPLNKLGVQAAIATAMYLGGVSVGNIMVPGGAVWELPGGVEFGINVLWVVGITNAFNLIDGSDGVAAGAAVFAGLTLAFASLFNGSLFGALAAFAIAGAVLGFLFFNFPPASIFLGNSGSLFIGFTLASLGIITAQAKPTTVAVAIPILALALPILDTSLAVIRRTMRKQPLFEGDRRHIHHRLHDLGHSPRTVALLLYAVCAAFALLSLAMARSGSLQVLVLLLAGVVAVFLVVQLRLPEIAELRRVLVSGLNARPVIARNLELREAAERLSAARVPDEFTAALAMVADAADFDTAELWLDEPSPSWQWNGPVTRTRLLWRWQRAGSELADSAGEVVLTLNDPDGLRCGRLLLARPLSGASFMIDFATLDALLRPALQPAFARMFVRVVSEPV
ncbi:MAG: MraY family glycosyltransferase [Gemmatimonadota bacterium]